MLWWVSIMDDKIVRITYERGECNLNIELYLENRNLSTIKEFIKNMVAASPERSIVKDMVIHICDKKIEEYKDAEKRKERKIAEKYQKIKAYAEKTVKDEVR